MGLFDNFFNQIKENESPKTEKLHYPLFTTIEYKISTLVDMINNVDSISDEELKNVIIRQHKMLLNYDPFLSNQETRRSALKLFTNKRFLNLFLEVIGFLNLSREQVICINKLAYDYYVSNNKDKEISELLLSICYIINNPLIIRLSAKMDITNARVLSMIANSTFKIEKKVHRVNVFFLKKDNKREFSVQDYIDIYIILFDHFRELFTYSMFEAWTMKITDEYIQLQYDRFLKMSTALIIMLDSLTSQDIATVLREYGYTLSMIPNTPIRFSIKNLKKYDRIKSIAYNLEINENDILIP
jgi:hypothetical protein